MSDFKAYIQIKQNLFRENYGLSFEEFAIGQKFKHRPGLTVSQQDNAEEALDTINNAQLHYDAHYASKTEWKKNLGVSTMTLQKVIGMTSKTFGKKERIIGFSDIAMTHPVFGGDTLYAESEIVAMEAGENPDCGIVSVITQGLNQDGAVVAKVQYKTTIYRRGKHPASKDAQTDSIALQDAKFNSHRVLSDGSLMEQTGIYYEDLLPGEIYEHRPGKTFTAEESCLHALRSLELNPQYSDFHYNEKYNKGKFPISEPFLAGTVTALTTRTFDRVVANLGWANIELPNPVYAGDTIYVQSSIVDKRESKSRPTQGIMHALTHAYNQNGILVCSFDRHFLVYKKGLGPYEAAGY